MISEGVQKVICARLMQAPIRSTMKDSFINLIGMLQKSSFLIGLNAFSMSTWYLLFRILCMTIIKKKKAMAKSVTDPKL